MGSHDLQAFGACKGGKDPTLDGRLWRRRPVLKKLPQSRRQMRE